MIHCDTATKQELGMKDNKRVEPGGLWWAVVGSKASLSVAFQLPRGGGRKKSTDGGRNSCAKALRWELKARRCEGSPVGEEEESRAM